jgi:NAD(P)-dependent dehydrogenase (short-subunit alcohol dehydrogenase family)
MAANGGGSIVNVSSTAATIGLPGMSVYSATKAALEALTRTSSDLGLTADGAERRIADMGRLDGRRILITGASSGVGLAAVERLAREGARLALLARGPEALEQAAQLARAHGAVAHVFPADVADREAVTAAVEAAVAALGGLDAVLSNAAAVSFGHFLETDPDDFDRTVAVTFTGAVNVIRAALPHLRASRGTVVATSSLMARVPLPAFGAYAAAKHALRGFLATLAIEEREQRSGVRVAMVSPGPVDTPVYRRATSGTRRRPAELPVAYDPDLLANALVAALLRPRHDRLVGVATRAGALAYGSVRPLLTVPLVFVDRWFRTGTAPAEVPGALWAPSPEARVRDGLPALRTTLARAARSARQLTRPVPEGE